MAYRMFELPMSGCCLNKTKENWATVIDFFGGDGHETFRKNFMKKIL